MNLEDTIKHLYELEVLKSGDVVTSKRPKKSSFLQKLLQANDIVFVYKTTKSERKKNLEKFKEAGFFCLLYGYKNEQIAFVSKSEDRLAAISDAIIDMRLILEPEECENVEINTIVS